MGNADIPSTKLVTSVLWIRRRTTAQRLNGSILCKVRLAITWYLSQGSLNRSMTDVDGEGRLERESRSVCLNPAETRRPLLQSLRPVKLNLVFKSLGSRSSPLRWRTWRSNGCKGPAVCPGAAHPSRREKVAAFEKRIFSLDLVPSLNASGMCRALRCWLSQAMEKGTCIESAPFKLARQTSAGT